MLDRKMNVVRGGAVRTFDCAGTPACLSELNTCATMCECVVSAFLKTCTCETNDPKVCMWIPATEYKSCRCADM